MPLYKHVKYKDKYGHSIEATFNVKKSTVRVVFQGIYERKYTDLEWQEIVQHDELYETNSKRSACKTLVYFCHIGKKNTASHSQ